MAAALAGATASPVDARGEASAMIGGARMRCVAYDGRAVTVRFALGLGDVGQATWTPDGRPLILINPRIIARFSNRVAQWWFAHECGHHALAPGANGETAADCYGIGAMVEQHIIRQSADLDAFAAELSYLPGGRGGHLPGPARVRNLRACASHARLALASAGGTSPALAAVVTRAAPARAWPRPPRPRRTASTR